MVKLIFVGGFLGAGKTTALSILAEKFLSSGITTSIITNDQTEDLVDTEVIKNKLSERGALVEQITEGCFCCQFNLLINKINYILNKKNPKVILGEPVGSCTDFIASVVNPIKKYYGDRFQIAPFTVLIEPNRLDTFLKDKSLFPEEVIYIFNKQLEEADVIALNKIDTLNENQITNFISYLKTEYPGKSVIAISAKQDKGIKNWINILFNVSNSRALQDIDYDKYAKGEAKLGWLNGVFKINSNMKKSIYKFSMDLLNDIKSKFLNIKVEIGHLKFIISVGNKLLQGNLTSLSSDPELNGDDIKDVSEWILIINIRANTDPQNLKKITISTIEEICDIQETEYKILKLKYLSPSYPNPPYILR